MTPFGAKIVFVLCAAMLFAVLKTMLKGTMKGEQSAPAILFITCTPLLGFAAVLVMIYLVKFLYIFAD